MSFVGIVRSKQVDPLDPAGHVEGDATGHDLDSHQEQEILSWTPALKFLTSKMVSVSIDFHLLRMSRFMSRLCFQLSTFPGSTLCTRVMVYNGRRKMSLVPACRKLPQKV